MPKAEFALNVGVAEVAERNRWRTRFLEDGELVIRLRGGGHAGAWGRETWYLCVPCKSPARRAAKLPDLHDKSGDAELLMLGPTHRMVFSVLANGPPWARAARKPAGRSAADLLATSFRCKGPAHGANS